ncbi:MAG TPA: MTH938/NDUFAF3 family protein [Vicinamibacterales bacterium]|nr:MTH938/NDUFAF3 family protein [Vicinamibacterales bacterium]
MRNARFEFGVLDIDGVTYDHDIVIDRGEVHRRRKKASKRFREAFGHTPLSLEEDIPWRCTRLVIGTGAYGRLPVMDDVKQEAAERGVELIVLPTEEALKVLTKAGQKTNAVLHVTC